MAEPLLRVGIAMEQLFHHSPLDNMLPDDGGGILGPEAVIDDPFRIDNQGGAQAAVADAAYLLDGDLLL